MIQHITIYKVKYQKHRSVPINDPNVWSAHFFPTHNFFIQRPCTLLCKNGLHTFDWHVILHTSQSDITRIVKDAWCNNFVTCRQKDTDAGFHRNVMHLSKRCTQTHAHTNREGGGRERDLESFLTKGQTFEPILINLSLLICIQQQKKREREIQIQN